MNIVDAIAARAVEDRPALISGREAISYGGLLQRVDRLAAEWTSAAEVAKTGFPRVGLACPGGVDYIVCALAILKAGGCLVPLAEELTAEEREEVIERTGLQGIWRAGGETAEPNARRISDEAGGVWWTALGGKIEEEEDFRKREPAFIRFSSGTTGRSKGVVLSHRRLLERIAAANEGLGIGPDDRVLWMLPMAHHFAVSIVLYLYHGACTVLAESAMAGEVLRLAEQTGATVIYGSPFHHALLAADTGGYAWPELRLAVSTAAPLPAATASAFQRRFGKPLSQGLGIIEIGLPLLDVRGECPRSVGRPLPAYAIDLRDESGKSANEGELHLKGPGMFDAYLSPWQPREEICQDGWFATGDLAERDEEGRVFLKGRRKSVLIVGGMKVFPEEVEAVLERHPAVKRARVTGLDHSLLGTVPVAEVILREGRTVPAKEWSSWCRERISAYKVPVKVRQVESLPLTASGKIRRC